MEAEFKYGPENYFNFTPLMCAASKGNISIIKKLIDLGAEDIEKNDDSWQVITSPTELMTIAEKIKDLGLKVEDASLAYLSNEEVKIANPEDQEKIERLYNLIDDLDDITNVYTNASW
jgi:transcriptional/translational regulatory protein YebC/TACO1